MKEICRDRINEVIICIAVFLLSLLFFHFVSDDYFFFGCSLAAKQFSDYAYLNMQFQGYIGIAEVYWLFYRLMPGINWHFVFMILYDIISLYLVLRMLKRVILKKINAPFFIIAVQVLFALFYIDNIIFVSHTRVSLIFCGISLFNLAFTQNMGRKRIWKNSLIFVFGMLLRPESGLGTLLIVGIGYFIYSCSFKKLLQRLWLPMLAVSVFTVIFTIDLRYTDIYVKKVEPEIEYKMMAKRVVDIGQMKTAKDSVKYEAALAGMWFDTKEITPAFMRSIILPGVDLSIDHLANVLHHLLYFYSYYAFVWLIPAILIVLGLFTGNHKAMILKILLFEICSSLIIYALDCNGLLVSHRHFLNLQFISLFVICFYFFDAPFSHNTTHQLSLVVATFIVLFGLAGLALSKYKEKNYADNQSISSMIQTMEEFERRYSGRIVAVNIDSRFLFDRHFSAINKIYTKNTYLMFDWFTFSLTPRYVDYLRRKCYCDAEDPIAFFQWLSTHNALYVSSPYRCDLTQRYIDVVYGRKILFGPPIKVNSLAGIATYETKDDEIRSVSLIPR
jgi:hypothetical protein